MRCAIDVFSYSKTINKQDLCFAIAVYYFLCRVRVKNFDFAIRVVPFHLANRENKFLKTIWKSCLSCLLV